MIVLKEIYHYVSKLYNMLYIKLVNNYGHVLCRFLQCSIHLLIRKTYQKVYRGGSEQNIHTVRRLCLNA